MLYKLLHTDIPLYSINKFVQITLDSEAECKPNQIQICNLVGKDFREFFFTIPTIKSKLHV